jgi:hypothetical protein
VRLGTSGGGGWGGAWVWIIVLLLHSNVVEEEFREF